MHHEIHNLNHMYVFFEACFHVKEVVYKREKRGREKGRGGKERGKRKGKEREEKGWKFGEHLFLLAFLPGKL